MKHLEYIDEYFKAADKSVLARQFDQKIKDDPSFAEEVAFYLTTVGILQEQIKAEKLQRFRTIWEQREPEVNLPASRKPIVRILRYTALAAAVAAIAFVLTLWLSPANKQALADTYISEQLNTVGVNMGSEADKVQQAKDQYNKGQFAQAQSLLESIVATNPENLTALELAGVASLRLQQYDKALGLFTKLAGYDTYNNPGVFYKALTLLKRDQPGDESAARALLQQVVDQNLAEKETARQWLDKW